MMQLNLFGWDRFAGTGTPLQQPSNNEFDLVINVSWHPYWWAQTFKVGRCWAGKGKAVSRLWGVWVSVRQSCCLSAGWCGMLSCLKIGYWQKSWVRPFWDMKSLCPLEYCQASCAEKEKEKGEKRQEKVASWWHFCVSIPRNFTLANQMVFDLGLKVGLFFFSESAMFQSNLHF